MNGLRKDVKPLTKAELNWVTLLETVLRSCPSPRLGLFTIGDSSLTVIDNAVVQRECLDLHDGAARRNGVVLREVYGKVMVHGVSG